MRNRAPVLILFAALVAPLMGQFNERTMATDMTGSELLFSTVWTLDGETQNPHSKLVRYRLGRLETYRSVLAERDPETGHLTNLPVISLPEMSLDGRRIAFTRGCPRAMVCTSSSPHNTEVRDDRDELVYAGSGTFALSANGRWAKNSIVGVVNLETGQAEEFWPWGLTPVAVPVMGRQVANDGTVVLGRRSTAVLLKRPGLAAEHVVLDHNFDTAVMADGGGFAVLQTVTRPWLWGTIPGLWIMDLAARTAIPMATADEGCHSATLSTDGSRVVFLSGANWLAKNVSHTKQAFLMELGTGELTQLTEGTDSAIEALITGDGRSTFVRFQDGSIVRVDNQTGQRSDVIPAAPEEMLVTGPVVPGSRGLLWIKGNRRPTLRIDGEEAKVLELADGNLRFVVPEATSTGNKELEVSYEGSPFQAYRTPIEIVEFRPAAMYWNIIPMIWHDEGGTAVWQANPAKAGEIVEVLMAGLGPVDAKGNTLLQMNWRFQQASAQESMPIEVVASRKSPYEGEEGLYRVKLKVPAINAAGQGALYCSDARDESVITGFPLAVTQ
jgi:uncharacterized protein (TIGR03437 family)